MKKIKFYEHPAYIGYASKGDDRNAVFSKQFEKQGFDDSVTWSLDESIIKFILPRLKRYYEIATEVIKIEPDFKEAIEYMIYGFEFMSQPNSDVDSRYGEICQKTFQYMGKYFSALWW